ncbi:flagellar hook-basal body complex protein [Schinkia azotoformans]|uniref:flagellar hook-basal body complex protein n=1 Tax=Schinkia azotoformans TaxID=1454 RepID=UPI002DBC0096|nr:flagellar hook-basal body complex protein [Schinkia azotoformans]MEC1721865.1 flagellar hook-basal body complex protein [Schinkia azotoformans]MED4411619.1 flagellar hook-basal body complex protein [Schinkia azotoformans]
MLRSMYSGISGMKNFQTKLDVIGNNIANVNTYGFKKGRVVFKDLISQQIAGASGPSPTKGGVNPKQVGLGSQLATIDTIDTPGSTQTTGRTLDLALAGDGYFMVGSGTLATGYPYVVTTPDISYTRAGNFYFDKDGFIVNSDGLYVLGITANAANTPAEGTGAAKVNFDSNGNISGADGLATSGLGALKVPTDAKSFSIGADGKVTFIDKDDKLVVAGFIGLGKFPNNGGLEKVGQNLYKPTTNSGTLDADGDGVDVLGELYLPGMKGAAEIVPGALEMSNVDLSEEFTEMIVAQRGFQANTKIITTSDEILQELVNLKR